MSSRAEHIHPGLPAGVLAPPPPQSWKLHRLDPPTELRSHIAWLWTVEWDLIGLPDHQQSTLPHPSAHLVIENGVATIHGPSRHRFTRTLTGAGRVVAIRFQPAGLRPFVDVAPTSLVDTTTPARELLPGLSPDVVSEVDRCPDPEVAMRILAAGLGRPPAPTAPETAAVAIVELDRVNSMVELIATDRSITDLAGLSAATGSHPRALQRLFAAHIGMGPKAIICRYRLQEAADTALNGSDVDWAATAARLGYYDQAHLTREFTSVIGMAPAAYARTNRQPSTTAVLDDR